MINFTFNALAAHSATRHPGTSGLFHRHLSSLLLSRMSYDSFYMHNGFKRSPLMQRPELFQSFYRNSWLE